MPELSDTQRLVRDALVGGDFQTVRPVLIGGGDPTRRLAIHHRHYHASLVDALRTRFPATTWLIGDAAVTAAARRFVATHPPRVFCIAEFGEDFPAFLAAEPSLAALPYVQAFARLEWHAGRVSVAVDGPALSLADLTAAESVDLMSSAVAFQPGVMYLTADWPVDELLRVYLSDQTPPEFQMEPGTMHVEVRGARGDLHLTRIAAATWLFRRCLQAGLAIGTAAEGALDVDPQFDSGRALIEVYGAGLVTRLFLLNPH